MSRTAGVHNRQPALAAAVFTLQTAGSGVAVYAVPIYLAAFTLSAKFTLRELSLATTAFFLASACSGVVYGRVRPGHAIPALLTACMGGAGGLLLMALAPSALTIAISFAVLGASFNGFVIVGTSLLVGAYEGRPTTGMALATAGTSAGGVVVSPVLALLFARGIRTSALIFVAVAYVVVCLAAIRIIRTWVNTRALPSRHDARAVESDVRPEELRRLSTSMSSQWSLLGAFSLVTASQLAATTYSVSLGISRGYAGAGLAVLVATGSAVASRWIGSAGIRHLGLRGWTLLSICGQAVGVAMIGFSTTGWVFFVGAALIGQSLGNTLLIRSQVVVEQFGVGQFSRRFGQFMTLTSLGTAIGPFLLGQVLASTASYTAGYVAVLLLNVVAAPLLVPWVRRGSHVATTPAPSPPPVGSTEWCHP